MALLMKTFCGLYSLKKGCIVIAYLHLIVSFGTFVFTSIALMKNVPEQLAHSQKEESVLIGLMAYACYCHVCDLTMHVVFLYCVLARVKLLFQIYLIYMVLALIATFFRFVTAVVFFLSSLFAMIPHFLIRFYCYLVSYSYYRSLYGTKYPDEAETETEKT